MPYVWTSCYPRKEDGRTVCRLSDGKRILRSRLVYCNAHGLQLENIRTMIVHHVDGDGTNDQLSNLQLVTHRAHALHHRHGAGRRSKAIRLKMRRSQVQAWKQGAYRNRRKRKTKYHHLVADVREAAKCGEAKASIARRLGIPRPTVQRMLRAEVWNSYL